MSLSGKTALVSGSGRNIGRATVLELARRGANVIVNTRRNAAEAEDVVKEARKLGVEAISALGDVGEEDQASSMVEKAISEFGRVDILINNAGLRQSKPLTEMTTEEWRHVLAVNLDGPFFLSRAVAPGMIAADGGQIINIAGLNAFRGRAQWAHVCSSKMGAIGLTRSLAMELAPYGIRVNHIVPGTFDTIREGGDFTPEILSRVKAAVPLGRLGLCEEIAKTCAFLASDGAGYITGQTIHVNGGVLTA